MFLQLALATLAGLSLGLGNLFHFGSALGAALSCTGILLFVSLRHEEKASLFSVFLFGFISYGLILFPYLGATERLSLRPFSEVAVYFGLFTLANGLFVSLFFFAVELYQRHLIGSLFEVQSPGYHLKQSQFGFSHGL